MAEGLSQAGHQVSLALIDHSRRERTPPAPPPGVRLVPVRAAAPPSDAEADRLWRRFLAASPLKQMRILLHDAFEPDAEAMFEVAQALCAENDLVIGHFLVHPLRAAAQLAGIPWASLVPVHTAIPTGEAGLFGLPDLGAWSHKWSWLLGRYGINRLALPPINALRRRVGLPPDRDTLTQSWASDRLNLVAVSPTLCPPRRDWGAQHVVCGFLNPSSPSRPEALAPAVEAFLAAGEPPVLLTFGSMTTLSVAYRRETARLWREAVKLAGVRAILQIPFEDPADFAGDPDILVVDRAPHTALFPRCALIVHHGGAGTTQTALRAGRPALIVAHLGDQFFWGRHLADLGAAAPPLKRKGLTAHRLAKAIRRALALPGEPAAELGRRIAGENGVASAVEAIERTFLGG